MSRNTVGHNNSGADQNAITPLWYKGFISKTSSNEFIEVPVAIGQKRIALYNFNGETNDIKKNLVRINSSFQRLLIYRTKNKNFHQVRLTYIPDYDYLEKNHFDASVNQITKLNSYSGYIEYRSVKGDEIFFLLRFKNGKMVSKNILKLQDWA